MGRSTSPAGPFDGPTSFVHNFTSAGRVRRGAKRAEGRGIGGMLTSYVPVLILLILASALAALILGLAAVMGPRGLNAGAEDPYESGIIPTESARKRFPVRF